MLQDEDAFFVDYAEAHLKLSELGWVRNMPPSFYFAKSTYNPLRLSLHTNCVNLSLNYQKKKKNTKKWKTKAVRGFYF